MSESIYLDPLTRGLRILPKNWPLETSSGFLKNATSQRNPEEKEHARKHTTQKNSLQLPFPLNFLISYQFPFVSSKHTPKPPARRHLPPSQPPPPARRRGDASRSSSRSAPPKIRRRWAAERTDPPQLSWRVDRSPIAAPRSIDGSRESRWRRSAWLGCWRDPPAKSMLPLFDFPF